jgi:hypothetical protein
MAAVEFNNATYYSVSDGKICRQHKQPVEGSIERTTKSNKVVHETFYRALKGKIVDIQTRENDYGKQWSVTLQNEDGTKDILQFQYSSGYAGGFLKTLPNVDLTQDVVIVPNMKIEGDKKRTTVFLQQEGKALKHFFTKDDPKGLPELKQIKVKSKVTWDDSDMMEFLEAYVNENIKPQLGKNGGTKTKVVLHDAVDVDDTEDAPF